MGRHESITSQLGRKIPQPPERKRQGTHKGSLERYLAKEPPEGDIRPYEGNPGILRLRVGGYRVIFRVERGGFILVSHVEPRGQAYTKKTKTNRGK